MIGPNLILRCTWLLEASLLSAIRPGQTRLFSSSLLTSTPLGLEQDREHIESPPAELHRLAVVQHFAALRQDPETAETRS